MPKKILLFLSALAGLLVALPLAGQKSDTLRLSLPDAVTRALQIGDEARLAGAQVELADAQVTTARATGLPQLRLNGNFSHVYENARANAVGQIFNQVNTYSTTANLSQVIFQGGRIVGGARAASRVQQAAALTQQETRARVSYDVQRAYLQVLFANRIEQIQATTYARAESHLKEVERFEQAGRAARYDVLRARVQLANLEPQTIQARSDQEITLLELKRLTNIPLDLPVVLTTAIDAATAQAIAGTVEANDDGRIERPSLLAAQLTASARHIGIGVARADFLPSVSIFIQGGFQAFPTGNKFPPGMGRIVSTECAPGTPAGRSCIVHNGGWFEDRTMGIQFSWPLFDGLRSKGNVDLAQAQARVADLQLAQQREQVALEVAEARAAFKAAKALFEARRQNSEEATEAFRLATLRFGRGLSTQLEVQDAQIAVMQAETNEARSIYDYYLAAAELARALGEPLPLPAQPNRQQPATERVEVIKRYSPGLLALAVLLSGCAATEGEHQGGNGGQNGTAAAQTPQQNGDNGGRPERAGQQPGGRGGPGGPGGRGNVVTLATTDVAAVRRGVVEDAIPITGNLQPLERVEVRARLEGELENVLVREGERVRPGQLLARFESSEQVSLQHSATAEVAAVTTELSTAQWNLDQTRELFKEGAVPERDVKAGEQQVASSRARLAAAESRLKAATQALNDARVVAPALAVVERRLASNGEHVNRGASLFTLVRTEALELTGAVPARMGNRVLPGQSVRFNADGRVFTGRVSRVSPTIDMASRSVSVYVQIPNGDGSLKGGTFANGRIISKTAESVLIVPTNAIRQEAGTGAPYVYRIAGESIERRPIQLGIIDEASGIAEVSEGLEEGDRIITGSVGSVSANAKVVIVGGETRRGGASSPPQVPRN